VGTEAGRPGAGQRAGAERWIRRGLRPALWLLVVLPAPVLVAQLLLDQLGANPIEELEHATGGWALRFLIASLAVTPLLRRTGWGWLVRERRFLGLAAFAWTVIHLSVYTVVDWFFDWSEIWKDIRKHLYITLGMLAFVLLVPLALTSTQGAIRRLGGGRWRSLHRLVYVAVLAGCLHYLWAVKQDITMPVIYASVTLALLASRGMQRRRPTA
jgi:sulfoxide reductase heme-binding subunit YedZ